MRGRLLALAWRPSPSLVTGCWCCCWDVPAGQQKTGQSVAHARAAAAVESTAASAAAAVLFDVACRLLLARHAVSVYAQLALREVTRTAVACCAQQTWRIPWRQVLHWLLQPQLGVVHCVAHRVVRQTHLYLGSPAGCLWQPAVTQRPSPNSRSPASSHQHTAKAFTVAAAAVGAAAAATGVAQPS